MPPQLTTLAAAKVFLQIPADDTTKDAVITALIPAISVMFRKVTGRYFGTAEFTEFYSGDGTPILILRNRPVQLEGLRVWVDNNSYWGQGIDPFPDDSELDAGTFALQLDDNGYIVGTEDEPAISTSGLLFRVNAVWPMCQARLWQNQSPELAADHVFPSGNVKVVYTAGETDAAIETAANYAISNMLQSNQNGGLVQSETIEDYSYQIAVPQTKAGVLQAIGPFASSILANYRELWF